MDQVSRPLLIVLIVVVGFAGVWMMVLRPKAAADEPVAAAPPPAAAVTPAPKAEPEVAPKAEPAPAPAPKAEVAPKPQPAPKAKPAAVPKPMVIALVGDGEDDALARRLVGSLRGVRTQIVPIDRIGRHEDLLGAIEIRTTPTILVIGADRRVQRLEGLPDQTQLDQALTAVR